MKKIFYLMALMALSSTGYSQTDSGCLDLSKAGELGYEDAYEEIKKYCQ